jgi:pimeloyl-ACP methyl ester carboxylesterase
MVHGGFHTGASYLVTPDGRPGWASLFAIRGYQVVVVDLPGFGRSGYVPESELTGELICAALAALIDELEVPVALFTHSMSGPYGWKLLETSGDRIRALVAVAPGPPGNIQSPAKVVAETDTAVHMAVSWGTRTLPRQGSLVADRDFVAANLIGASMCFPVTALETYLASLVPTDVRLLYERANLGGAQLRVGEMIRLHGKPVLILTGSHDGSHPRRLDEEIATWLGSIGAAVDFWYLADHGVVGNGHMLMLEENSEQIAEMIIGWLHATCST